MVEIEEIFAKEDEYHLSHRGRVSEIECEFRTFCSDAVVVGCDGELAAEVADGIIIKRDSQLQFNGHTSFAIAEIPDTFTQNGINHRSNLILCAPNGILVSHSIQCPFPH